MGSHFYPTPTPDLPVWAPGYVRTTSSSVLQTVDLNARLNTSTAAQMCNFAFAAPPSDSVLNRVVATRIAGLKEHSKAVVQRQITSMLSQRLDCQVVKPDLKASLVCPISLMRMETPARFVDCTHIQCFDAGVIIKMYLLSLNDYEPDPVPKCPLCAMTYRTFSPCIRRNSFFEAVLKDNRSQKVNEFWIRPDGTYYFSNAVDGATVARGNDGKLPKDKGKRGFKVIDVEHNMTIAGFPDVLIVD